VLDGAVIGAGESGFVAEDQLEALAVVGQVLEGPCQAGVRAGVFECRWKVLVVFEHVVVEDAGFDGGEATEAPLGGGDGFDQVCFDCGGGGKAAEIRVAVNLEVVVGFGGEEDLFRMEAVFEGVLGGARSARGSGGAGGFGAVGAARAGAGGLGFEMAGHAWR